jgi:hypothetical protein
MIACEEVLARSSKLVRARRATLCALVLGVAAQLPASADDRPPQSLHQVGDHWTAWDPPPAPTDGSQVYVIAAGDTLWALAQRFYNDPYLWPQLWERNQYIQDAHWIYPGDPLATGPAAAAAPTVIGDAGDALPADGMEEGAVTAAPGVSEAEATPEPISPAMPGVLEAEVAAGAPVPLGAEDDIYCSGYLGEPTEEFAFSIVGSEYESLGGRYVKTPGRLNLSASESGTVKDELYLSDIVYLDGGRVAGMSPGTVYTVVAPRNMVKHPVTGQAMGRFYAYLGRVRVLTVQDSGAIAEIVHSCAPIEVGDHLKAFEPEPVPLARRTEMRPQADPIARESLTDAPVIVYSNDERFTLGQDHVVYIDRGGDDDVTPGDVYTVYRLGRPDAPPVVLGELAVLSVQAHSSLARIVESRYAIHIGDRLERK